HRKRQQTTMTSTRSYDSLESGITMVRRVSWKKVALPVAIFLVILGLYRSAQRIPVRIPPSIIKQPHPTSFETDPDRTKTTYCKNAYTPTMPLVQYALMV